jgi:hypothetical protein
MRFFCYIDIQDNMIILPPSEAEQTFKFIPREDEPTHLTLTDEQDNTTATYNATFTIYKYYLQATDIFTLQEDRFYILNVYKNSEIIYKDKLYCTSQTDYSINNNVYTQHSSNNEYITL